MKKILEGLDKLPPYEKGRKFEVFVKHYLKKVDPRYRGYFKEIWLWDEYPYREGHDMGVDIVAVDKYGKKWAIQVKYHEKVIRKSDIDSFLSLLGTTDFDYGMIVTKSPLNRDAEKIIKKQQKFVAVITLSQMLENIDEESFSWDEPEKVSPSKKKKLRPYQKEALEAVIKGFEEYDRGKLIMPPGSGKTFVALKIAEKMVGKGGTVLFLCPSISLLDQTLRAWTSDSSLPLETFAVVSDKSVGKSEKEIGLLSMPPTTDPRALYEKTKNPPRDQMRVIFSTYQSLDVIEEAQRMGMGEIDLIICDEAHRTTGVKVGGEDPSTFKKVHYNEHVRAKKRLYMTATPRIFEPKMKEKLEELDVEYYSMDDVEIFGPAFYEYTFVRAVDEGYLSDYKVIIFFMDEKDVLERLYEYFQSSTALNVDPAVKILGTYKVLQGEAKTEFGERLLEDFRKVIVFTSTIKESRDIAREFEKVAREYEGESFEEKKKVVIKHIDGTMSSSERKALLDWLRESEDETIKVLTNAKVLTEGIDVPALDAVVFLRPKNSVVEIIQALGRVMRRAPGKRYGYVIIPAVIRSDRPESEQMEQTSYKTIWQIVNALRAIDETFEAKARVALMRDRSPADKSEGEYRPPEKDVIVVAEPLQMSLAFDVAKSLKPRIAKTLGLTKKYLENWARDVSKIAERFQEYIKVALEKDEKVRKLFDEFYSAVKAFINEEVREEDAINMIVQHILTKPIFDALFYEFDFIRNDIIAKSLDELARVFEGYIQRETKELERFYRSIENRAIGIESEEERQEFLRMLYDSFFRLAFSKTAKELGIVYTPVEVVDFIVKSVDFLLKKNFGKSLSDEGVVILEPFAGTGTFVSRLLSHIAPEKLERKYKSSEIWANEILLLPYYIARANIESTFYKIAGKHEPFENLLLVDTFKMMELIYEDEIYPTTMKLFPQKYGELLNAEKSADVNVIISNPPWFTKKEMENLGIKRPKYEKLRKRISDTYVKRSRNAHLKNSLYDSYIMAIRMATDRIERGVIGFVTNNGWIDNNAMDGMREVLTEEFSEIYILDLRGNARKQGNAWDKEGDKIFGQGSRAGVCIALFVKDPSKSGKAKIYYHDIGDYLSREEKLRKLKEFEHAGNVEWLEIVPNQFNDWINQRSLEYYKYPPIGSKKKGERGIFEVYSAGLKSNRDAWVYNFSRKKLEENMRRMIEEYNRHVDLAVQGKITEDNVDVAKNNDPAVIAWDGRLIKELLKKRKHSFEEAGEIYLSMYRPFVKMWVYFSKVFNNSTYQLPKIFPTPNSENVVIGVSGKGSNKEFSTLIMGSIYDVQVLQNSQAFPLYIYYDPSSCRRDRGSMDKQRRLYIQKSSNVSRWVLSELRQRFKMDISPEDVFYYIYGLLHSPDYRKKFENELRKDLPRIPLDVSKEVFEEFREAGEKLAKMHLEYESYDPYPLKVIVDGDESDPEIYRIDKMKLDKDSGILIYNDRIRFEGIPKEAFDYKIGGYSPLEWIVNFYKVQEKGKTKIIWDPNDWLEESGNPKYVFDLVPRLVKLSIDTLKVIRDLEGVLRI